MCLKEREREREVDLNEEEKLCIQHKDFEVWKSQAEF
jgi:hypothetical protein